MSTIGKLDGLEHGTPEAWLTAALPTAGSRWSFLTVYKLDLDLLKGKLFFLTGAAADRRG